jgi:hypothetical protein
VTDGPRACAYPRIGVVGQSWSHSLPFHKWDPKNGSDSHGRPSKNDPPLRETREAEEGAVIDLPPYSITVVTMEEYSWEMSPAEVGHQAGVVASSAPLCRVRRVMIAVKMAEMVMTALQN